MTIRLTLLLLLVHCLVACSQKNSEPLTNDELMPLEILEKTYPKNTYEIFVNESEDFALVCKHLPKKEPFATLVLSVVDLKTQEVIYKESVPKGTAFWQNNEEIGIQSIPGIVRENETGIKTKLFNVYTKSFNDK